MPDWLPWAVLLGANVLYWALAPLVTDPWWRCDFRSHGIRLVQLGQDKPVIRVCRECRRWRIATSDDRGSQPDLWLHWDPPAQKR